MSFSGKKIFSILLGVLSFISASALVLPVKTVGGRQFYYYNVGKSESLYGISHKLGIPIQDIIRHNPAATDGLRSGTVLYFPVEEYSDHEVPAQSLEGSQNAEQSQELMPESGNNTPEYAESAEVLPKNPAVGIALGFGRSASEASRAEKLSLEFYKGFLIAADTLSSRSDDLTVNVCNLSETALPSDFDLNSVIILSDSLTANASCVENLTRGGTYLLNLFDTRDTLYRTNPYMIQASVPGATMYTKAIDAIMSDFSGYIPVIIKNTAGRNEKEPFTEALRNYLTLHAIDFLDIEYSGNLQRSDLGALSADSSYVIIPSSGSLAEFNKFAHVLANMRDALRVRESETEEGEVPQTLPDLAVFGYPDWLAFRGEAELTLHQLEATIYSRFFEDSDGFSSRILENDFRRWFGSPMMESVPSQGLLGFDAGCFVIRNMNVNGGRFAPSAMSNYTGVQSTFHLEHVNGGGWVNTAVYIIKFLQSGRVEARVV